MFTLNQTTNRYEATLKAGTLVSISSKRFEDDAFNRASMSFDRTAPFADRLESAKAHILANPDIYRTKHNGFSVVVISVRARKSL